MDPNDGLTPEEQQFFQTGDASVLGLHQPEEPPAAVPPAAEPPPVAEPQAPAGPTALEQALESERRQRQQLEQQLAEARKPPKPVEEPLPDETTDPLGHMMAQLRLINKRQEALEQQLTNERQQSALTREVESFKSNVQTMKADFTKATPDFDAAYNHLRDIRIADLMDSGSTRTEATQQVNQGEFQLAANAIQNGKNPAEVIYNMAKRYGYTPAQAAAAAAQAAPAAAAPNAAAQKKAEEQVQRLANGQFATRAPARASPPASAELTTEGLKDAGEGDLNKIAQDDKLWQQIVGGKAGGDIFHH